MKKWLGPAISVFLVIFLVYLSGPFGTAKSTPPPPGTTKVSPAIFGKMEDKEEKQEPEDTAFIQVLRAVSAKLDEWLKDLNERIEREDITRLEVRFLEILRNILEWIKEKIDAKIESSSEERDTLRERLLLKAYALAPAFRKG